MKNEIFHNYFSDFLRAYVNPAQYELFKAIITGFVESGTITNNGGATNLVTGNT